MYIYIYIYVHICVHSYIYIYGGCSFNVFFDRSGRENPAIWLCQGEPWHTTWGPTPVAPAAKSTLPVTLHPLLSKHFIFLFKNNISRSSFQNIANTYF